MSPGAKAYPAYALAEEDEFGQGEIAARKKSRLARYHYAQPFVSDRVVLNFGCGCDADALLLAQYGAGLVVDCEIAEEAGRSLPRKAGQMVSLCRSREEALPLADRSIDLITAFEGRPGTLKWDRALPEMKRVLSERGVLLVSLAPAKEGLLTESLAEWVRCLETYFSRVTFLYRHRPESPLLVKRVWNRSAPTRESPFVAVCADRISEIPMSIREGKEGFGEEDSVRAALEKQAVPTDGGAWSERLDEALGAAQATIRLREYQLELLKQELADAQSEAEQLRQERALVRRASWLRLGQVLGVGPWKHENSLGREFEEFWAQLSAALAKPFASAAKWRWKRWDDWQPFRESVERAVQYGLAPVQLCLSAGALAGTDLAFQLFGRKRLEDETSPRHQAASIVIPNWNGLGLLRDFLPSVLAAVESHPENEVIVVDNASSDGSATMLANKFPGVRVVQMRKNAGFGGACNAGVAAARNEVVVLLNNDMRVERDFLAPLLEPFADPLVFAVASQIFIADPTKRREETGLTQVWWHEGRLGVTHHVDGSIKDVFPCAYPGGGSSAFDKRKFLELGGFDDLYRPFYYEDTDLGRLAWKRGWKVLYQAASVVHHNHRGTIGKTFSDGQIRGVVRRNAILYCWKNIHDWRLLTGHFARAIWSTIWRGRSENANQANSDLWCGTEAARSAFKILPRVLGSRWRALERKAVSDQEAFRRPLGGYYRDRFLAGRKDASERLNVLFVSPYPIEPPVHGGAVFMRQTVVRLASITNLHLISFVDSRKQLGAQERLRFICHSVNFMVRPNRVLENQWTLAPNAIREFHAYELEWAIHRAMYRYQVDVLQLDYTVMGQYGGEFKRIACLLFEHDISMQSLARRIRANGWRFEPLLEFVRMRLYEPKMLERFDRIQVCSQANLAYLTRAVPSLRGRVDADVRAAIEVDDYPFVESGRDLDTLLFIGSFRHQPNTAALTWFTEEVFPRILAKNPNVTLMVVGSDPPTRASLWNNHPNIRLLGTVPDVRQALQKYSVFVCPVLSGSGVRVKLLEAFASGIPCVSTKVGAEGLAEESGRICELADQADTFARLVLSLLRNSEQSRDLARRARVEVEENWDAKTKVFRLERIYREEIKRKQDGTAFDGLVVPGEITYSAREASGVEYAREKK